MTLFGGMMAMAGGMAGGADTSRRRSITGRLLRYLDTVFGGEPQDCC
jgi:hypothetical protein